MPENISITLRRGVLQVLSRDLTHLKFHEKYEKNSQYLYYMDLLYHNISSTNFIVALEIKGLY
jgi:hypothetical protein